MASLVRRELSAIYGTFEIGADTDRHIDGFYRQRIGEDDFEFEFEFVTHAATEAAFATEIAAVEAAATKRQRFRVFLEATDGAPTTIFDANPTAGASGNTGFDTVCEIRKVGDEKTDTGRSRRYAMRVSGQLPADFSGQSGRRDASVQVQWSPERRRTLTVSGTYTALAANDATAQYTASIAAYASAVQTALGGTYRLVGDTTTRNDTDKLITFTRVLEEEFLSRGSNAAVQRQVLTVTRSYFAPGDSNLGQIGGADKAASPGASNRQVVPRVVFGLATPNFLLAPDVPPTAQQGAAPGARPHRLIDISVAYDASLDHDVTTDPEAYWESNLRAYVIDQARSQADVQQVALVEQSPVFDFVQNKVSARLRLLGQGSSTTIEAVVTTSINDESGLLARPVATGASHVYDLQDGPPRKTMTINAVIRHIAGADPVLPGAPANYRLLRQTIVDSPRTLGMAGYTLEVNDRTVTREYLFATPYPSGGAGQQGSGGQKSTYVGPQAGAPKS